MIELESVKTRISAPAHPSATGIGRVSGLVFSLSLIFFNLGFQRYPNLSKTRPDTQSIPVADGWVGAEMRVFTLSNSIITDRPTDGRTKPLIELRVRN